MGARARQGGVAGAVGTHPQLITNHHVYPQWHCFFLTEHTPLFINHSQQSMGLSTIINDDEHHDLQHDDLSNHSQRQLFLYR